MRQAFGPYTLVRSIAVGGIGEVFEAEHRGGVCAIKRLHRELAERSEQVELFEAEAALAHRLSHPNLVQATDSGQVEGWHYIAFDLVRGPNLVEHCEPGLIDRREALRIAADLCAGVECMHDGGFAHCDISPSNILLTLDGRALLTDFGVASRLDERQPEVRGTFAYMSPEQAKGAVLTRASDVFAIGVVLWELLAGARLFRREAQYLTIAAVVEQTAPPIGDDSLDALLARALDKSAARRYRSCSELGDALKSVVLE